MPATTPLCRCRVFYIGSSVPTLSKDGLQGIQEPLTQLYPADGRVDSKGIDAWLSVWVNGLVLEYADGQKESFFPIQSLHYCAAVRYVNVGGYALDDGGDDKFLPLDSPFANLPDTKHPPIFAGILRRTSGVKVLECHGFICRNVQAANALVRCCFHAYADSMYYMDLCEGDQQQQQQQQQPALKDQSQQPGRRAKSKQKTASSSRSSSPTTTTAAAVAAKKSGVGGAESDSDAEVLRWSDEAARASRQAWQKRQQSGDYETASISSSLAGRYKKKSPVMAKHKQQHKPRKAPSEAGALVPFWGGQGGPGSEPGRAQELRRAYSEMDMYQAAARDRQMVPYGFPGMGGPPPPPMPPMHMGPFGPMPPPPPHMFAPFFGPPPPPMHPGGPPMFGGPMPPPHMMPPPPPSHMGMPPFATLPRHPMPPGAMMGPPPPGGPPPPPMPPHMLPHPHSHPLQHPHHHQHMMQMMEPMYGTLSRPPMPNMEDFGPSRPPFAAAPWTLQPPPPPPDMDGYESYARPRTHSASRPPYHPRDPRDLRDPRDPGHSGHHPGGRRGDRKTSSSGSSQQQRSDDSDDEPITAETRATIEHHQQHRAAESGLFRRAYINEKAFGTSIQNEKTAHHDDDDVDRSPAIDRRIDHVTDRQMLNGGGGGGGRTAAANANANAAAAGTSGRDGGGRRRGGDLDDDIRNLNITEEYKSRYHSENLKQQHMIY